MPPIRVLQVMPAMDAGGMETFVMNVYRTIDREKVQFDFLYHYDKPCFFDDEIRALGGRIFKLTVRQDNNLPRYLRELRALFAAHPEWRIIHGHYSGFGMFYSPAARRAGIPVRCGHSHNTAYERNFVGRLDHFMSSFFNIGLTDQIRLLNDKPFYFQFGLMLHNKGGKVQATDGGSDIELSLNAMYLELPVMLNYHIRLAPKVAVIPFAGFYGSLGVDGKQSFDDLGLEIQQNLFGKNKMFQRGDFGGRIGIGLSIHSVYIGASYGGGFLNIAQEDDTSKFRNRSWSLSVGYDF